MKPEVTISNDSSSNVISLAFMKMSSALDMPHLLISPDVRLKQPSQISIPVTRPVGPTILAAGYNDAPPPVPIFWLQDTTMRRHLCQYQERVNLLLVEPGQ
jgi:hypothetical protein